MGSEDKLDTDFDTKEVEKFEEYIDFMEKMIRVHEWESCKKIQAYLTIHGSMQAPEISKKIGLEGAKSVYKPLRRLIDAGLVSKAYEEGSKRNAYYYSTLKQINDPPFTPKFIEYLIQKGRYQLISDYLVAANLSSMGFLKVMTDVMRDKIIESNNPSIGEEYIQDTLFVESILSLPNPNKLNEKIMKLLQEEFPKYKPQDIDPKQGVPDPAAFFLAVIPISQTSPSE